MLYCLLLACEHTVKRMPYWTVSATWRTKVPQWRSPSSSCCSRSRPPTRHLLLRTSDFHRRSVTEGERLSSSDGILWLYFDLLQLVVVSNCYSLIQLPYCHALSSICIVMTLLFSWSFSVHVLQLTYFLLGSVLWWRGYRADCTY